MGWDGVSVDVGKNGHDPGEERCSFLCVLLNTAPGTQNGKC